MDLRRSDLFGFVPDSPVLEAEEAYGGYDPQHWHQRRGGPVVASEEAYGEDWDPRRGGRVLDAEEEYSFALHDEDEDVMFGEDDDLGDVPLFGGEGDEVDQQLDQILSEMEADEFGADPLTVPVGTEDDVETLATIIMDGARNAVIGQPESWTNLLQVPRRAADTVADYVGSFFSGGDTGEIAQALISGAAYGGDPGRFCSWNDISDADREAMVHDAIYYAMWPGIEMHADDAFWSAWQQAGLPSSLSELGVALAKKMASSGASAVMTFFSDDLPRAFVSAVTENAALGSLMRAVGFDPTNQDQTINQQAMGLWFMGKLGIPFDAYIAKNITDRGQSVVAACQQAVSQAPGLTPADQEMLEEALPAPVQSLDGGGMGAPDEAQILAAGYGLSILGSLAGFFG